MKMSLCKEGAGGGGNQKKNKVACNICFEVRIPRKRKWNFLHIDSFKNMIKKLDLFSLIFPSFFSATLILRMLLEG